MSSLQPGILADVPTHSRYLWFRSRGTGHAGRTLADLATRPWGDDAVLGLGAELSRELGVSIEGLRTLPALTGPGVSVPSTPRALFCWLRGSDRGALLHRGREIAGMLDAAFELDTAVDGFRYRTGHDLSGFEDGTENPVDDLAVAAAAVSGRGLGLDGSSFVAVQLWRHDLDALAKFSDTEQSQLIGRDKGTNEELADAPASAHVKRTEQERFGFVLRRSMPWTAGDESGLVFVAFGKNLDAFEAQLSNMVGSKDGVTDGLFRFTRPIDGAAFWCPPVSGDGRLDLSAIAPGK